MAETDRPSNRRIDRTGQKYGRLLVLNYHETRVKPSGQKYSLWWCRCDCGIEKAIPGSALQSGTTVSCGCHRNDKIRERCTTHGMSNSRIYSIWHKMIGRCTNTNDPAYPAYGGRGIGVCERWLKFENFYKDMGDPPSRESSIDRIDVDGGYSANNCRWASPKEQGYNRRKHVYNGERSSKYKGVIRENTKAVRFRGRVNVTGSRLDVGYGPDEELLALRFDKARFSEGFPYGTNYDLGLLEWTLDEKYPCDFWYYTVVDPKVPKPIKLVGEILNA